MSPCEDVCAAFLPGFPPDVAPPEQGSLAIFVPLVDLELGGEGEGVL